MASSQEQWQQFVENIYKEKDNFDFSSTPSGRSLRVYHNNREIYRIAFPHPTRRIVAKPHYKFANPSECDLVASGSAVDALYSLLQEAKCSDLSFEGLLND